MNRASASRCWYAPGRLLSYLVMFSLTFVIPVAAPLRAYGQEPATQQSAIQTPPQPLSPIELAQKNGTALPLSLKDITKLALQNNLDIAIQDTNEDLYQQKVLQAYAPYDPTMSLNYGVQSSKSANTNTASASNATFNSTDMANWNVNFSKAVRTGGTFTSSLNSSRSDTNQLFALFTPQYNARGSILFSQPLLRNFKIDSTRANIKLANLDINTNDSQFKQKVNDTVSRIQGLYWDLVSAIRDYEIKRDSVKLAQITLRDNTKKVEIGTLAPIGITEAKAEVANREVELIASEERIYSVENNLRALISSDKNAEIWQKVIVPTETPEFKDYKVELTQAIDTALANRPELEQLSIQMQRADIGDLLYRNNRRWELNLVGGFGATGVAGPQSVDPLTGKVKINPDLVGGFSHAYRVLFSQGYTNWSIAFQMVIPLKNTNWESQLAQLKITKRQLLMNRKSTEQTIQVEIRNAVQSIETTKKQVDTATVGRQLAKEQLEGEEKRFQAGLSENFRVLDRQRGLSSAQYTELQALIAYKKAIINLQKAMYTLLEANDFEIAKTSSDNVASLK
jgi:outer membrane protein